MLLGFGEAEPRGYPSDTDCHGEHMKVETTTSCNRKYCWTPPNQECSELAGPFCCCIDDTYLNYCNGNCVKYCECPSAKRSKECYDELKAMNK